jgi:hypothetical protein
MLLGEGRAENVPGQIFNAGIVSRPDGRAAIDIKVAVMPTHTALWPQAIASSPYDLEAEPLLSDNAILPCLGDGFSWETITRIRRLAGR